MFLSAEFKRPHLKEIGATIGPGECGIDIAR